jgi:hypothetical protein
VAKKSKPPATPEPPAKPEPSGVIVIEVALMAGTYKGEATIVSRSPFKVSFPWRGRENTVALAPGEILDWRDNEPMELTQ